MSIEFLVSVRDELKSMLEDLINIKESLDDTWDIDVFALTNFRQETEYIKNKAMELNNRAFSLISTLGSKNQKVKEYTQDIIILAKEVEQEAKKIIKNINKKDVLTRLFKPVETSLEGIANQMISLLERLRPLLPSFLQKLLPPGK